jgi:hypothetical protein
MTRAQREDDTYTRRPAGYRLLSADGQEIARQLDARTAYAMATAAAAEGYTRQVVTPEGVVRRFEGAPASTPEYIEYVRAWPRGVDPRD